MKYRKILTLLGCLILIFSKNNVLCLPTQDLKLKDIERRLTDIEQTKKEILREYLKLFIRNHHISYLKDEYPLNRFLEKTLLKKIIQLNQERLRLETKKAELINMYLFNKKIISQVINPVSGEAIKPGEYSFKLTPPVFIRAPISGMITNIKYLSEGIMVKVENEKCSVSMFPLSSIRIDLGEKVVMKEILGEVKNNNFLRAKIKCSSE